MMTMDDVIDLVTWLACNWQTRNGFLMTSAKIKNDAINQFLMLGNLLCIISRSQHVSNPEVWPSFKMNHLHMCRHYRGVWYWLKIIPNKILLTGPKFNLNNSSGSSVIKKIVKRGGVHPLDGWRVNRVKDALSLNSELFTKSFSLF